MKITIILILLIYIFIIYNVVVKQKNCVKHYKSTIEVYLTQRFDLIPNLEKCVKEYAIYEKNVFEKIIKLRYEYMKEKDVKKGITLNKEINNVMIILENVPELKADSQFKYLRKKIVKIENQIQAARRTYNNEIETYNTIINIFPNNILAKIFGFKNENFFEMEKE